MKKILISMALLLVFGGTTPLSAQQHRHAQRTETVDKAQDKNANDSKLNAVDEAKKRLDEAQARLDAAQKQLDEAEEQFTKEQEKADNEAYGIEAYSDTSSVSENDAAVLDNGNNNDQEKVNEFNRYSPKHFDDPFSWFAYLCTDSFWGFLFTMIVLLLFLFFLFLPFIIVVVIVRYVIRRHNDRVRLAEMAMKQGRPLSEEQMSLGQKSPQYMWRRGVRNLSIGIGLMLFFGCMQADPLVGVGALIACMGGGQMFMARYNFNFNFKRRNDFQGGFGNFDDNFKYTDTDDMRGTTWANTSAESEGKEGVNEDKNEEKQ